MLWVLLNQTREGHDLTLPNQKQGDKKRKEAGKILQVSPMRKIKNTVKQLKNSYS